MEMSCDCTHMEGEPVRRCRRRVGVGTWRVRGGEGCIGEQWVDGRRSLYVRFQDEDCGTRNCRGCDRESTCVWVQCVWEGEGRDALRRRGLIP